MRFFLRVTQCNPIDHAGCKIRQSSARGNQSRVEVAGPGDGRQYAQFRTGEERRLSMTQPFVQDVCEMAASSLMAQTVVMSSFAGTGTELIATLRLGTEQQACPR